MCITVNRRRMCNAYPRLEPRGSRNIPQLSQCLDYAPRRAPYTRFASARLTHAEASNTQAVRDRHPDLARWPPGWRAAAVALVAIVSAGGSRGAAESAEAAHGNRDVSPVPCVARHPACQRSSADLLSNCLSGQKDLLESVEEFAAKTIECSSWGFTCSWIDLFPLMRHDPRRLARHGVDEFDDAPYDLPLLSRSPWLLTRLAAGHGYVEHASVGGSLPEMPLFLHADRYILCLWKRLTMQRMEACPRSARDVLEGPR